MSELDKFAITFDIDWAPDFIIDAVASVLRARRIRATWFITHQCRAINHLRNDQDLFELGLHPNFVPGSTQGNTPQEVLAHLYSIVPEATNIRTHSLVQSGSLLRIIMEAGLRVDVSLFLPGMANIRPFEFRLSGRTLLRVPYFWSDDYEMEKITPCWHLAPYLKVKGLKIINFHPIYVYLNSGDPELYNDLKRHVPILAELTPALAETSIRSGEGPRTFLEELIDHLAEIGESVCIRDIYSCWYERGLADE